VVTEARARLGRKLESAVAAMPPARQVRFRLVLDVLEGLGVPDPVVLDAGCGDALLAEEMIRRHPAWRVVAVDSWAEGLQRARERLAGTAAAEAVELLRHDLREPLPVAAVDAVVAVESLVEIEDDDLAIEHLAKALRPGGLFVAHVPEAGWQPVLPGSERTWRHQARQGYTAEQITSQLARAGLTVRSVVGTSRGTVRVAQEIRDRIKGRSFRFQAPFVPLMALAAWLERHGLTWGPPRALLVVAVRESSDRL